MWVYILKRLLLMIPTLLGVLLLTFVVIQFVPGGPVEQYLAEARAAGGAAGAEGGAVYRGAQGVDPKRIEQIKALYGFDKPAHERFFQMLGQFARFDEIGDVVVRIEALARLPDALANLHGHGHALVLERGGGQVGI